MAEYEDREHYIPLRKNDLMELLCKDKQVKFEEREPLRQFCRLTSAVFHFEYLQQLEDLKDAYAPFDPDSETRPLKPLLPEEREQKLEQVFDKFTALMERANFERLTREEVEKSLKEVPSDWGIPTHVNMNHFDRILAFTRGDVMGERSRRRWSKLFRKETIKLPVFSRLVMILKFKKDSRVDADINKDAVFLKVFKDIPKMDVPMLIPGARVRLTRTDRALIVYPLLTGVGLMLYNIAANIYSQWTDNPRVFLGRLSGVLASGLLTWSAAAALGGYGYKSYHSYEVKKQDYNLRLAKSLYYQGLDSNSGVLMRLLDEAEEQECRETYLAWFCLWKYAPPQGWTPEQLDDYVELYLEGNANLKVDFEIGDALDKLERLSLVKKADGHYHAVSLDKALEMLDYRWDNYFKYNNPEYEAPPEV
jgi:hypothetical protein